MFIDRQILSASFSRQTLHLNQSPVPSLKSLPAYLLYLLAPLINISGQKSLTIYILGGLIACVRILNDIDIDSYCLEHF